MADKLTWEIAIGNDTYYPEAASREDAIRIAFAKHRGVIGVVIDTRMKGQQDGDSVPWRSVDVAWKILGNLKLAKTLDDAAVSLGLPSVLPSSLTRVN
jgi:hypothetical protein